jgi:hypothetical protein
MALRKEGDRRVCASRYVWRRRVWFWLVGWLVVVGSFGG